MNDPDAELLRLQARIDQLDARLRDEIKRNNEALATGVFILEYAAKLKDLLFLVSQSKTEFADVAAGFLALYPV